MVQPQPWYITLTLTLIPSLVVAIVVSILTVRLSLRKFYTEKWWERKADAYSRIVEALLMHKNYAEQKLKIEMSRAEEDSANKKNLEKQWSDANAELERSVDLGAFVISEETEKIIRKFLNRTSIDPDYWDGPFFEIIEADISSTKKCLSEVKKSAKKDLKV